MNFLLRVAKIVVDSVLTQLTQQQNIVQQLAIAPMNAMVQQVVGGVWIGKGADKFVQEVTQALIPTTKSVDTTIGTMARNIIFARDRIERADQDVIRLIKGRVFDAFKFF